MPLKLIIFDLDGTLIHSLPDLADAANTVRDRFNLPRLGPEEVRKLVGKGARSLVERALPGFAPEQVDEGLQLFLSYNLAHISDKTRVYPGVFATLEELRAKGFELGVLSNKNVALCREVLNRLRLSEYFRVVYGADSHPERKPSPEPVLALMAELGVEADETVLVGDSINDIAAGAGAGVRTVGCSFGYGDPSELEGADFRIAELPALLKLPLF